MIDFMHPRTRIVKMGSALSMLSIVVLAFGVYITIDKITEYRVAKQIASYESLPSGDYLLTGTTGPSQELESLLKEVQQYESAFTTEENETSVDTQETTAEIPAVEDIVVAGVQYDAPATQGTQVPHATTPTQTAPVETSATPVPKENRIVIPRMGVDALINEGATDATLRKGVWRMPHGSTPDAGGNTIITAHRYLYRPPDPRTFFLIDKLIVGDTFTVYWEGVEYTYKVRETKIVDPTEISILYNTPNSQITLFSCTPLFTSEKRLVVIADEI